VGTRLKCPLEVATGVSSWVDVFEHLEFFVTGVDVNEPAGLQNGQDWGINCN
jgi:hypothetical protein